MKKMILAATVLAMAGASLQTAKAGDRECATAGVILTGVVAGAVIASALDCPPAHASVVYTYNASAYCPPPAVVYAPVTVAYAPPVVYSRPVVVYRAPVCAPRPMVYVQHGHYRGYERGRGHHDRW
jgi:hypothetical protein